MVNKNNHHQKITEIIDRKTTLLKRKYFDIESSSDDINFHGIVISSAGH